MATISDRRSTIGASPGPARPSRLAGPMLVLSGIAFSIGGATHPVGGGEGNKVQQLHEMLVDGAWYPSHVAMLAAVVLFTVAVFALRGRPGQPTELDRLLKVVLVVACATSVSMVVHLLAPLGAGSIAEGQPAAISRVQALNEAIDAVWGLAVVALAVAGGRSRSLGNRITMAFGVVGGVAFAVASATIAFTDAFDPLFKAASLISVWAVLAGGLLTFRRSR